MPVATRSRTATFNAGRMVDGVRAEFRAKLDKALRERRSDPQLLASAASVARASAERRLMTAMAARDAGTGDPTRDTADVVEALEAFELAEQRAARLGVDRTDPYSGGEHSFFRDLWAAEHGNVAARQRLGEFRLVSEIRSGLGVTSSFVAPAFDTAAYADVPRQEAVLTGLVRRPPLPKGLSISIPAFSASVSTAPTGQNTAPSESDIVDSYLTRTVGWVAGLVTVSAQLFEQSWTPDFDEVAAEVLTAAFDEDLESQAFTGTGSSAQILGALNATNVINVTYTAASPTQVGALTAIGEGLSTYARKRKKIATAILMTPTRWAWLASGQDLQDRPLLQITGPRDAIAAGGTTPVGTIGGVPVFVTSGIPSNLGTGTNQDAVVVCRPSDSRLYINPAPSFDVFQDTSGEAGNLSYVLACHGSAMFVPDRYPSVVVGGTGFAQPAGW